MFDRQSAMNTQPDARERAAPRVLIADDDPGIRLLMEETLSSAGFEVSGAESGSDAIALCGEFRPDLVLLDINMPSVDGITACAEIRNQSDRDIPIIMVTSVDDAASIQRAFDAGATDFILKPINWPLFQRRLESVLQEWNTAKEIDANKQRMQLLEKVVPELVMLVARNGDIIEDLKHRDEPDSADAAQMHRNLDDLYGTDTARRLKQRISGVLKTGRHNHLEFVDTSRSGPRKLSAQFLPEGREQVIVVVQHAGDSNQSQSKIFDLAFVDEATGLPNQNLFNRWAEEKVTNSRLKSRSLTFLSLCFDDNAGLEQRDASFMRALGDCLDRSAGQINATARIELGDGEACVARIAVNHFMLVLEESLGANDLLVACENFAHRIADTFPADGGSTPMVAHFGTATYPADGDDLQSVMLASDAAMLEAQATGTLSCSHSQVREEPAADFQDYGDELRQALDEDQLELYFQPRKSLPQGAVTCVEALLRWNHPMRGFVDLDELLHLAKASGLIAQLGNWVLTRACETAARWSGAPPPRVSVNLSQQEFARHDLAEIVSGALEQSALEPGRLELELTEAALLRSKDGLAELRALKALGVGLVLDDFGTGHTSLARLKQYPIDALKIDGSFLSGLPDDPKNAAVCEVIVTMAHLLGMKSVAEGVESEEQLKLLRDLGCDEFQGFHLCKPLSSDAVDDYLDAADNTVPE